MVIQSEHRNAVLRNAVLRLARRWTRPRLSGTTGSMRIEELNHVALDVRDVERSCAFYERALGLERIPRPDFEFAGAWLRLCDDKELHLIAYCRTPSPGHDRGDHFALRVDDLDAWERHWQSLELEYVPRRFRPDGAEQMYVSDPDGHVIELFTPPPEQPGERRAR